MQLPLQNFSNKLTSVTVVIVNWNCGDILVKCIDHLLVQTVLPTRILIMDNGSSDDSLKNIPQNDRIEVCRLGSNLGFAAANNRAISLCDTKYIALLNPDAFPKPDWLERLLAAGDSYPEIAAFGSLQLCDEDTEIVDGTGDSYHVSGRVWRNRHHMQLSVTDFQNREIFSPCAAAALYRRDAINEIGGFDEDFFCYIEDVDLGFRLQLVGYKSMYIHDAIVNHVGSSTTGGQHSDFAVYYGHRNLVWTFVKNMPGILFWLLLSLHLLLNIVSLIVYTVRGKARLICHAKLDAIKGLPKIWVKRKRIQKKRVASIAQIWQVLDKNWMRK